MDEKTKHELRFIKKYRIENFSGSMIQAQNSVFKKYGFKLLLDNFISSDDNLVPYYEGMSVKLAVYCSLLSDNYCPLEQYFYCKSFNPISKNYTIYDSDCIECLKHHSGTNPCEHKAHIKYWRQLVSYYDHYVKEYLSNLTYSEVLRLDNEFSARNR